MRLIYSVIVASQLFVSGCQQSPDSPTHAKIKANTTQDENCPVAVMTRVQHYISAQDGQGHGPDPGSAEWFGSIEHRLGHRTGAPFPKGGTLAWCDSVLDALNVQPTFNCDDNLNGAEQAICDSASLAALDIWLEDTYMNALQQTPKQQMKMLQAVQRGWIKGRDNCGKEQDVDPCVRRHFIERISELQAMHALVAPINTATLSCPDGSVYTLQFFATPMSAMTIEDSENTLLLWQVRAASGTRYEGANTLYWEHQGSAQFISGVGAETQTCMVKSHDDE